MNTTWRMAALLLPTALLLAAGCDGPTDYGPPGTRPWEQVTPEGLSPYDPAAPGEGRSDAVSKRFCTLFLLNTDTDADVSTDYQDPGLAGLGLSLPLEVRQYRSLHEDMPPAVREAMAAHNLRNYSVYVGYAEPEYYGVRYYEYVGTNYVLDMAELDRDEAYRAWREKVAIYEVAMIGPSVNSWEAAMDQVFHADLTPGTLRTAEALDSRGTGADVPGQP